MKRLLVSLLLALLPAAGWGQTVIQGGSWTAGRVPMYSASGGGSQPIVQQSAPASGGAQSLSELSLIARGSGTAPYTGQGTGYLGAIQCWYDGPTTGAYHQLCVSPSATGGFGMLSYNAFGGASSQDLKFVINGTTYPFPFTAGSVAGPGSSTVGHIATWANTSGTLLADGGVALTIGGTNAQLQYNNNGVLGGVTMTGDAALNTTTGNLNITSIGGQSAHLGGALHTDESFTVTDHSVELIATGATHVTLPTAGTLATRAGSEALTNKTYNGLTVTSTTGSLTITNGKVLTASNTLQFTGTDGSTLNVGTGGTLGAAAYTAASAYMPAGVQASNVLGSDTALSNTGSYFTGPTVAQGSTGTWFCSGTVTVTDTAGAATINAKLWDGTTVVASAVGRVPAISTNISISLSGYLATPAGNMRISVNDATSTSGAIKFNASGNSKDSTLSCFRTA